MHWLESGKSKVCETTESIQKTKNPCWEVEEIFTGGQMRGKQTKRRKRQERGGSWEAFAAVSLSFNPPGFFLPPFPTFLVLIDKLREGTRPVTNHSGAAVLLLLHVCARGCVCVCVQVTEVCVGRR